MTLSIAFLVLALLVALLICLRALPMPVFLITVGLLGTIAIQEIWGYLDEALVAGTRTKLKRIHLVVEQYQRHHLGNPTDLTLLLRPDSKNLGRPYVENEDALLDAWGNPMRLREVNGDIEVISYGKDGSEGGTGLSTDLSSRDPPGDRR